MLFIRLLLYINIYLPQQGLPLLYIFKKKSTGTDDNFLNGIKVNQDRLIGF